jgi:hypothetical protein
MNRFVTGLDRSHFIVRENDIEKAVAFIATPDDRIAIALVAEQSAPVSTTALGGAELYVTRSVADALRSLGSNTAMRKALIITTAETPQGIPADVFVQRVVPEVTQKAVVEARSRYVVGFASADTTATAVVVLKQPSALPPLKPIL